MRHLLDCIKHDKTPVTDGCAGQRVVRLLELAQVSIKQGGRMINVD
jgi:hypothetical protein